MDEQHSLLSQPLRLLFKQYGGLDDMTTYASNQRRYLAAASTSTSTITNDNPTTTNTTTSTTHQSRLDVNSQRSLSCVLFIGRLVWLMKLRGDFVKCALKSVSATSTAPKSETGAYYE